MPPSTSCCAHDHDCEATDCGVAYSLYKHIDVHKVRCLNAADPSCSGAIFRPWSERLSHPARPLRSNEDDPELLIHVPFDGAVKLKAICVIGGAGGTAPAQLKVFINRYDLDFGSVADMPAVQEWGLAEDNGRGILEYPTQVAKFNGVHAIDLYFPSNFGADATEILYIGFKGEFSERKRQAVEAVYEARPVPKDHAVPGTQAGNYQVGQ